MRQILKEKIFNQRKRIYTKIFFSTIIVMLCCGCNNSSKDTTKEYIGETVNVEVSGSMDTVFVDSKYVSGNTIDEFIEDKSVKELVVTNKFSKNEDSRREDIEQTIQREGEKYVLDGKKYSYFYKLIHNGAEVYLLGDIIMDKELYDDYLSSSLHREEGPVVVATNILN